MPSKSLIDSIDALSPAEKEAVGEFIEFLKQQRSPFRKAIDEFIQQHPELLTRLAQ